MSKCVICNQQKALVYQETGHHLAVSVVSWKGVWDGDTERAGTDAMREGMSSAEKAEVKESISISSGSVLI